MLKDIFKMNVPADPVERLKLNEIRFFDEFVAFLEDNEVQNIDDTQEVTNTLNNFGDIVTRFKECHTDLKLAMGDKYHTAYKGRD